MKKESVRLLDNGIFYCQHLLDDDNRKLIQNFQVKNDDAGGLENFIKEYAYQLEESNEEKTYVVKDSESNELVAYFSIKAGTVRKNERVHIFGTNEFDLLPGVEISNFAVNSNYCLHHDFHMKIGEIVMADFIFPIIKELSQKVAINTLYLFVLPSEKLIQHYKDMGFQRLSLKHERKMHHGIRPRYDKGCIFMRMSVKSL